jgi:hypothetical protein
MGEPTPIQYAVEIGSTKSWIARTTDVQKISDDRRRFSAWMIFDIKSEVYVKRQTANELGSLRRYARSTSNELNHRDMSGSTYRPGYDPEDGPKRRQSVTPGCWQVRTNSICSTTSRKTSPQDHKPAIYDPPGTRRNWKNYGHGSGHGRYGGRFGCEMPRSHAQGQNNLKIRVPKEAETATIHSFNKRKSQQVTSHTFHQTKDPWWTSNFSASSQ